MKNKEHFKNIPASEPVKPDVAEEKVEAHSEVQANEKTSAEDGAISQQKAADKSKDDNGFTEWSVSWP